MSHDRVDRMASAENLSKPTVISNPNIPRWAIMTFVGLGTLSLLIASWTFTATYSFVSNAIPVKGTVVGYVDRFSRDRDGQTSHTYAPRFRFATVDGQNVEVVSRESSSWRNEIGVPVDILYLPDDPHNARLDSVWQWLISAVFGTVGGVFLVIGTVFFVQMRRAARVRGELRLHGTPIRARFVGVEMNTSISYNGRSPWRVLCQWQNPADARVYVFASDDVWFDPTEYVPRNDIRVLIDPAKPTSYHVDLSFLPMPGGA